MANVVDIQQAIAIVDRKKAETEAIEEICRPYNTDGAPFNEERLWQEIKFFLFQEIKSKYEIGKRLIILKEFISVPALERRLETLGMPKTTAWRYMQFARIAAQWPKFRAVFERPGMLCKGLALLEGLSDPEVQAELQKLEETGELRGVPEAELLSKTFKELQRENRRLRKEKAAAIEAATTKSERENTRLRNKLQALEAQLVPAGLGQGRELLSAGEKLLVEGTKALAKADFGALRRDAESIAVCRELIGRLRRVADYLEGELFGEGVGK